jgi:hypothetical protein
LLHVDANIFSFPTISLSLLLLRILPPTPASLAQDIAGDKEEVHSSRNKEEMAADVEDSARKGKEKVADLPKSTKKRVGGGRSRGTGGKSLDSRRFEAQHRAKLETPSEAIATINMPKSK